ncbi:YcaO-like family protein [Ideonella sp. YS5]|uniref:YcaO-like family protein n=1 Tax=Ideonella sp. YS5 TaxID=3453714 RepID=UPI003EED1135
MKPGTSLRSRPAAQTVAAGRPFMGSFGIEHLTEITSLDRLGLPVFVSARPRGLTARIHAGKGMTAEDAHASALMEAIECAVAERVSAGYAYDCLRLGELAARLPDRLALTDFSPHLGTDLQPDRATMAVPCTDLLSGSETLLPAELVMVPPPEEAAPPLFGWSSNGLASGNTVQEATLHGLLEVLERDTITFGLARSAAVRVDPATLPECVATSAARWKSLGVQLFVRCLPGDFGLPCFEATLHEPDGLQAELARGWGIHFDRQVALARAVCEAAQSRLCALHSAQPGMAPLYRGRLRDAETSGRSLRKFLRDFAGQAATVSFQDVPHQEVDTVDDALECLLSRLPSRGFPHAFRFIMRSEALAAANAGLHVVKVVVPGCENVLGSDRRAGPRLLELSARQD